MFRNSRSEVLLRKSSENMQQTYNITPMPKCDFNKVANRTSAWVLSCKFAYVFRTPFLKNASEWLLLNVSCQKVEIKLWLNRS